MAIVHWFNAGFSRIFDILLTPFASFHPLVGLFATSVLIGIVMLVIFRYTSDQDGIRQIKEKIKAHLLEVRLYKDDLSIMLEAQRKILRSNLTYMRYSLAPMAVMIVPVVLILIQMNLRFGHRPLVPGESAIVAVKLRSASEASTQISLSAPVGVAVETPALRIPSEMEVDWRIRAKEAGEFDLEVVTGDGRIRKKVVVGNRLSRVSIRRSSGGLGEALLNPGEVPLPKGSVLESIEVKYPQSRFSILGWRIHWLLLFFVLSVASGFALKGVFKVQI